MDRRAHARAREIVIRAREDLAAVQRVVIKVGSSLLTNPKTGIDGDMVKAIAGQVNALRASGVQVCLVSSGAVALGRVHLGWLGKTLSIHEKQAAAAVGQPWLMEAYRQAFASYGVQVAQMLLTKDDLRHRRRYLNASNTSETLFSAGVVPIVNENDTVVVEEIKFGDNDRLGALVSLVVDADLLLMVTDVDGLFDANPNEKVDAKRCSMIAKLSEEVMAMAGDAGSQFGTGGMLSKLKAADVSTRGGVAAAIVNGKETNVLGRLIAGEDIGTLILSREDRTTRRQHWIADVLRAAGQVVVDQKAAAALRHEGRSLLPISVLEVHGKFDKGECIEILEGNKVIAKGLSNYNSDDLQRIKGLDSKNIEAALGYLDFISVVHPDNLVLLDSKIGGSS